MSLARLANQEVEILPFDEGATDEYNNPTPTWPEENVRKTTGWLEQIGERENTDDRNTQITEWTLVIADPDAELGGRDRVRIDGITYEVIGPPRGPRTPRGRHHLEVRLRHVDG